MILNWNLIGTVMIDFKKAFDLGEHSVLFASYLSVRKQKVSIKNIISDEKMITDSALQGSILGPLHFLMFTDDFPLYTYSDNTDFYANDTTLCVIGESLKTIKRNFKVACKTVWLNGASVTTCS